MNFELLITIFWCVIAAGFIVRFLRAPKGRRIRNTLKPGFDAIDSYQENLIGKTGAKEASEIVQQIDEGEINGTKDS